MRIHLLGGLEVAGLGHHDIGSRKARTLLKVLAAARGRPVTVDVLVDILWPQAAPARPAEQLQVLVSRLRGTFGPDRLVRTDAGYVVRYDWLDIDELDARTNEAASRLRVGSTGAARAAAAAAMRLVGGGLLPDDEGEWVEHERRAVERTIARARLIGAEAALQAGEPGEAATLAEGALDHDPYDEPALRVLMTAHAAAERPASALAAYARCRRQLAEQLGVDPAPETTALHTAILLGEHTPPPPTLDRRIVDAGHLVGRAAPLAALDGELALAANGVSRAVVVTGEPGIGKTALVGTWAGSLTATTLVLSARCDELGRELPLQPVLDTLATVLRQRGPAGAAQILGADVDLLGPLLDVGGSAPVGIGAGATTIIDIAAGQTRLFAALVDIVVRLSEGRTVVIVVDDLHLGADSMLAWLAYAVRHAAGLLVVATWSLDMASRTWPSGLADTVVPLGPLDLNATSEVVGVERAANLHRRSGGNPLFLVELAGATGDDLPGTIVEAVRTRADALGAAATLVRCAAVLGSDVDVDLLAACTERRLSDVLDDLEAAVRSRFLVERGTGFAFAHEVVREALAADVTAARRAFVHREAARALRQRPDGRSLHTAFHARLGGAGDVAAAALMEGAKTAAQHFDLDVAERLLDQSVLLADGAESRRARARVRMARSDHDGAADDIGHAIDADAEAGAFELAGWIAYYRRDYVLAQRYADEAVRRAEADAAVRASALALGGRIRHSRGQLPEAEAQLEQAVQIAPPEVRGVADVWLGSLRVHQGRAHDALATLDHIGDGDELSHPFALAHCQFARCHAHGLLGRLAEMSTALAALDRVVECLGPQGRRFEAVARNMSSWLLRSTGRTQEADEASEAAVELSIGTTFEEPHAHARLDLAESRLRSADPDAATIVDDVAATLDDDATMAWHVHQRILWMRGRLAFETGDAERAAELAATLIDDATTRGSARYRLLGEHLAALAAPAALTPSRIEAILSALDRQAGIDAWWLAAELAAATGSDAGWIAAEGRAARLLASAGPDVDRDAMRRWVDRRLDHGPGVRRPVNRSSR